MKCLPLVLLTTLCVQPAAAQELYVEFSINTDFTSNSLKSLRLEVDTGGQFLSANGIFVSGVNTAFPAVGTCFITNSKGVFCSLQADYLSFTLDLQPDFNGLVTVRDGTGAFLDSSPVTLIARRPVTP